MNKNRSNNYLLSSLLKYIRRPKYDLVSVTGSFKSKLSDMMQYWSLGVVVAFLSVMLSAIFLSNIGVDDSQNVLEDFFNNGSIFVIVLVVFFVGPITEELTFRLGLRFSPFRFGFALVFVLLLLLEVLMAVNMQLNDIFGNIILHLGTTYFLILSLFLIIVFGFLFSYIVSRSMISEKINNFYKKHFALIFYSFTFLFGVIHFFNFANFKELWFVLPLLFAPQIFLGFILSYIRMGYGLPWSIFYHFFHNTLAALPILLFAQISDESMDIILNSTDNNVQDVPFADRLLLLTGSGVSLLVFILVVIFFVQLMKNHRKYLISKNHSR